MKSIEIKNGCVFYYGNPAGYVDQGAAVLDNQFHSEELEAWIEKRGLIPEWMDGIYDRLAKRRSRPTGRNRRAAQILPDLAAQARCGRYDEVHILR
jgi:hypothetical protein